MTQAEVLSKVKTEFPTLSTFAQESIARFVLNFNFKAPTMREYRRLVVSESMETGASQTAKRVGIGRTAIYRWRRICA